MPGVDYKAPADTDLSTEALEIEKKLSGLMSGNQNDQSRNIC
jgi:hypothetical protein